ncbi:MAG: hypothetical protein Ct9H90mP9_6060 [Pseudomonadota bacterium]|nr:MAG: hypothetical protein Ct9H90mP9_6060 [Pseudomonadota bacterium]
MKLPEARQLELKNLEELTDQIEEKLADKETAKEMLSLLKNPRFASMMKTEDSLNSAGTYKPSDLKPSTVSNSAHLLLTNLRPKYLLKGPRYSCRLLDNKSRTSRLVLSSHRIISG